MPALTQASLDHELYQITLRIKLKAARLSEKALDKLEGILDSAASTPETIRRTAVNIFSILGIPTAPVKAQNARVLQGDPTPPPKLYTAMELSSAIEQVHLRSKLSRVQIERISDSLTDHAPDPEKLNKAIRKILSPEQATLLSRALANKPLPPIEEPTPAPAPLPHRDPNLNPNPAARAAESPLVTPCQSTRVLPKTSPHANLNDQTFSANRPVEGIQPPPQLAAIAHGVSP